MGTYKSTLMETREIVFLFVSRSFHLTYLFIIKKEKPADSSFCWFYIRLLMPLQALCVLYDDELLIHDGRF
ncbi:hypothetical protein EI998_04250 [Streptococcus suis]|uniref:Uncharacterized protein n=1 Tax=Streptococcus suis TaxID=1307 RepID=A0A3R8R8S5_STRSU|nr:hypothetical protein EI998_04250 [Streptococcus suis]